MVVIIGVTLEARAHSAKSEARTAAGDAMQTGILCDWILWPQADACHLTSVSNQLEWDLDLKQTVSKCWYQSHLKMLSTAAGI